MAALANEMLFGRDAIDKMPPPLPSFIIVTSTRHNVLETLLSRIALWISQSQHVDVLHDLVLAKHRRDFVWRQEDELALRVLGGCENHLVGDATIDLVHVDVELVRCLERHVDSAPEGEKQAAT